MTTNEVENLYRTQFLHPFPYNDCFWICEHCKLPSEDFIPELDLYFSNIAGYSSSATSLEKRPMEELRKAKLCMQPSFFEINPSLRRLEAFITPEQTPRLHHNFQVVDQLRLCVLEILEALGIE